MMEFQTMNDKMKNSFLLNKKVDAKSLDVLDIELNGIEPLDDAAAQKLSGGLSFSSYTSSTYTPTTFRTGYALDGSYYSYSY